MLSDEERMAIEHIKNYPINWLIENVNESAIKIVLNLIEKQSKEIEELKEKNENLFDAFNNSIDIKKYWVNKDKIKAKIEELEKELEDIELKNINKDEISKTTFYFIDRLKCKIDVLQTIFEKE